MVDKKLDDIENNCEEDSEGRAAIRALLKSIGFDCNANPELEETPRRIVDLFRDMTAGCKIDIKKFFQVLPSSCSSQMIIVKDIEFVSMCMHHWWPFHGKVHIAYIPDGKIIGLSKFISAVRVLAKRPQYQEGMTAELANAINETLKPKGVFVVIEGTHTCMMVGGRYDYGMPAHTNAYTITSLALGNFLLFEAPRNEALALFGVQGGHR